MRRLLAFVGGVLSGGAVGAAVALLFSPRSGDTMRANLRQHWVNAQAAGASAAEQRRQALEAQLAAMTGQPPPEDESERSR